MLILIVCVVVAAALIVAALLLTGVLGGGAGPLPRLVSLTVGRDVAEADITEFYYTIDSSTDPPEFQRYRLSAEDGKHYFYHETREGDHWPLTEADITVSGTKELSEEEWAAFYACLNGGSVKARSESADSGGRGPWLFLYWKGDRSKYQEFSFADRGRETSFEELCRAARDAQ